MKVCVLGPVATNCYWGGVASFTEALADALKKAGHETMIISDQFGENPIHPRDFLVFVKQGLVAAKVSDFSPDIVIASLHYGRYFRRIKRARKVYFLHGFFNFSTYGIVRTLLAVAYQKWMCMFADEVVSNSHFTQALNNKIWGIRSDKVTWLGVDDDFTKQAVASPTIENPNNGTILYAGRLVKGKSVEKIINAFSALQNDEKQYTLVIAGDGPLKGQLEDKVHQNNLNVMFLGRIEHDKMYDVYRNAEVFISLNETEPFGLTYLEALFAGNKIVCPKTGGQVEFLCNYAERIKFVDPHNESDIAQGLQSLLGKEVQALDSCTLAGRFSYDRVVQQIVNE